MLFPFDRKITQNTRKIIFVHIFTSNHFRTEFQTCKERERERERARLIHQKHRWVAPSTGEIAPIVAAGSSSAPPSRSSPPKTNPPKTDLILDPPKTKLIHRAMPKTPASRPLQLRRPLHSRNPENPFLKPTPTNPPLRRTHSSNPPLWRTHSANPFLKPPLAAANLSLSHLSPSLTLRCYSDFFVLIFVSLIVYIFWFSIIIYVWILRKCEKHDKNGFSRAFLTKQPNTRKYFPKHFLECNQILENIFFFRK